MIRAWNGLDKEDVDGLDITMSTSVPTRSSLDDNPVPSSPNLTSELTTLSLTILLTKWYRIKG